MGLLVSGPGKWINGCGTVFTEPVIGWPAYPHTRARRVKKTPSRGPVVGECYITAFVNEIDGGAL